MFVTGPEFKRIEPRGTLTQLSSKGWKQVNVLEIKQSSLFGGHYHKRKKELFYVVKGAVVLSFVGVSEKDPRRGETLYFAFYPGESFVIEPFERHSLYGLEDAVIVVLLSSKHSEKDTFD